MFPERRLGHWLSDLIQVRDIVQHQIAPSTCPELPPHRCEVRVMPKQDPPKPLAAHFSKYTCGTRSHCAADAHLAMGSEHVRELNGALRFGTPDKLFYESDETSHWTIRRIASAE